MNYTRLSEIVSVILAAMATLSCEDRAQTPTGHNDPLPDPPAGEVTYHDGTVIVPGATIVFRGQVLQDSAEVPIGALTTILYEDSVYFFYPTAENEVAELSDSASSAAFANYVLSRLLDGTQVTSGSSRAQQRTSTRTLDEQWRVGTGLDVETLSPTAIRVTNTKYRWAAVTSAGGTHYLKPPEPLDFGLLDILQVSNLLVDPNPQHVRDIPYAPLVESYGSSARLAIVEFLMRRPVPMAWESQSYWEAMRHNPDVMRSLNRLEWAHMTMDLIEGSVGSLVPYSSCLMVALQPSVIASIDALIDYHEAGGQFEDYDGSYTTAVIDALNSAIDCIAESFTDENLKDAIGAGLRKKAAMWSGLRSFFDIYPIIVGTWDTYFSLYYAPIVKGGTWVNVGQIDSSPCSEVPGNPVNSLVDLWPKGAGEVTMIDTYGNIIAGDGVTWLCELSRDQLLGFWPHSDEGQTVSVSGLKLRGDWALIGRNVFFDSAPGVQHTYVECWRRSGSTWSYASSRDIWPNISPLQYVPAADQNNTLWVLSPGGVAQVGSMNAWDFEALDVGNGFGDISFAGPNNGWVVGSNGKVFHYDGSSWEEVPLPNGGVTNGQRILAFESGGAAVIGTGNLFASELFVYRFGSWQASLLPYVFSTYCLDGTAVDDIWALFRTGATEQTMYHWTGLDWVDHGSGHLTRVPGIGFLRMYSPHEGWGGSLDGNLWHYEAD
ncbi:MAG: hypothetical protein IPG71_01860 [bacterium]|nr:hypothetical protein [bacterium]